VNLEKVRFNALDIGESGSAPNKMSAKEEQRTWVRRGGAAASGAAAQ